ncbi:alpha/beta hydrolase family protein [Streptomyces nodosus]|uniref:hypothetical protein n=1 Tax=Streptomyces nodosus TaxID=40318 RepID=UPI0037F14A9E
MARQEHIRCGGHLDRDLAYPETGDLDIFRTEVIRYAATLAVGGVPVELHVHPGAPHGFDRLASDAAVTRRAHRDGLRVIATL